MWQQTVIWRVQSVPNLLTAILSLERQRSQTRTWNQGHWRSESLITTEGILSNRIQNSSSQVSTTTMSLKTKATGSVRTEGTGGPSSLLTSTGLGPAPSFLFQAARLSTQRKPSGEERCGDALRQSCSGGIVDKWSVYKDKHRFIDHLTVKATWNQASPEGKYSHLSREESNTDIHVHVRRLPATLCALRGCCQSNSSLHLYFQNYCPWSSWSGLHFHCCLASLSNLQTVTFWRLDKGVAFIILFLVDLYRLLLGWDAGQW